MLYASGLFTKSKLKLQINVIVHTYLSASNNYIIVRKNRWLVLFKNTKKIKYILLNVLIVFDATINLFVLGR